MDLMFDAPSTALPTLTCRKCTHLNFDGIFCRRCGNRLVKPRRSLSSFLRSDPVRVLFLCAAVALWYFFHTHPFLPVVSAENAVTQPQAIVTTRLAAHQQRAFRLSTPKDQPDFRLSLITTTQDNLPRLHLKILRGRQSIYQSSSTSDIASGIKLKQGEYTLVVENTTASPRETQVQETFTPAD